MFNISSKLISVLLLCTTFFTFTAAPALAAVTYLYDANGNQTSDGTNCYTYNEDNDLTQVRNCSNGQLTAEYVYDDQGIRGESKIYVNGVLDHIVYTPSKDYETTKNASTGALQQTVYYYVNDQIAARKNPDGTKTFYHEDNLNSTSVLTNQSGQLVEKTTYYPFGGIQTGGTQSKVLYTGQRNDSETGLDYYNARYYNPQIRRFTQPDTYVSNIYDPQDLNEYSYVKNNPLTYNDPSGHDSSVPWILGASALIGGSFAMKDVDNQIDAQYQYASINPIPFDEMKLKAESTAFAKGALTSAAETGVGLFLGGQLDPRLAKLGLQGLSKTIVSSGIIGAGFAAAKNTYANITNKQSLFKNTGQTVAKASIVSMVSSGLASKIIPNGIGRPSTNLSFSLNVNSMGPNALRQVARESVSDYFGNILNGFFSLFSTSKKR